MAFFGNLVDEVSKSKELTEHRTLLKMFKIPFSRELMTSNLLMNNYGRTVRTLHQKLQFACGNDKILTNLHALGLHCDKKPRHERNPNTISPSDFELHIFLENVHVAIRIIFLILVLLSNSYTYLNLRTSVKAMDYTSIQLIRFMLSANLLFFFSELWLLCESFFPIIPQKELIEFTFDDDYNFDLWEKTTFFLNMESVRMILDYRYDSLFLASMMRTLLIFQNILINISRIYAAIILVAVMFCVLYDVRKLYGGRLKKTAKMNKIMKTILISSFFIVTGSYITTGCLLFLLIGSISYALANENVDCEQKNFDSFAIRAHSYLMAIFFIITIFAAFILFCYHKIEETIAPFISKIVQEEMQKTTANLLFAT
uniref:Gustatory receptor n=1 Tax=Panagrolaimus sp. JU765 TaxID=591449 RepID=A0AC34RJA9_9BILA